MLFSGSRRLGGVELPEDPEGPVTALTGRYSGDGWGGAEAGLGPRLGLGPALCSGALNPANNRYGTVGSRMALLKSACRGNLSLSRMPMHVWPQVSNQRGGERKWPIS